MTNNIPTEMWLSRIFGHEGEFWDDPVGGPTKWGISQRSYPSLDIKGLTKEDAAAIYRKDFIDPLQLDIFPRSLAFQLLDFAVNSGPKTAIRQLQEAIGATPDGVVGSETVGRLARFSDDDLCALITAERLEYMTNCKNWKQNCTGWVRRMASNLRYAALDTL